MSPPTHISKPHPYRIILSLVLCVLLAPWGAQASQAVQAALALSVRMNEYSLYLSPGEGYSIAGEMVAPINPLGTQTLRWTSEDPTVAAVDVTGRVTALKEGVTGIRLDNPSDPMGRYARCEVTVSARTPAYRALLLGGGDEEGGLEAMRGLLEGQRRDGIGFERVAVHEAPTGVEMGDAMASTRAWGTQAGDVTYVHFAGEATAGGLLGSDGQPLAYAEIFDLLDGLRGDVVLLLDVRMDEADGERMAGRMQALQGVEAGADALRAAFGVPPAQGETPCYRLLLCGQYAGDTVAHDVPGPGWISGQLARAAGYDPATGAQGKAAAATGGRVTLEGLYEALGPRMRELTQNVAMSGATSTWDTGEAMPEGLLARWPAQCDFTLFTQQEAQAGVPQPQRRTLALCREMPGLAGAKEDVFAWPSFVGDTALGSFLREVVELPLLARRYEMRRENAGRYAAAEDGFIRGDYQIDIAGGRLLFVRQYYAHYPDGGDAALDIARVAVDMLTRRQLTLMDFFAEDAQAVAGAAYAAMGEAARERGARLDGLRAVDWTQVGVSGSALTVQAPVMPGEGDGGSAWLEVALRPEALGLTPGPLYTLAGEAQRELLADGQASATPQLRPRKAHSDGWTSAEAFTGQVLQPLREAAADGDTSRLATPETAVSPVGAPRVVAAMMDVPGMPQAFAYPSLEQAAPAAAQYFQALVQAPVMARGESVTGVAAEGTAAQQAMQEAHGPMLGTYRAQFLDATLVQVAGATVRAASLDGTLDEAMEVYSAVVDLAGGQLYTIFDVFDAPREAVREALAGALARSGEFVFVYRHDALVDEGSCYFLSQEGLHMIFDAGLADSSEAIAVSVGWDALGLPLAARIGDVLRAEEDGDGAEPVFFLYPPQEASADAQNSASVGASAKGAADVMRVSGYQQPTARIGSFPAGRRLEVYTGPGTCYFRANDGNAAVSSDAWIEVIAEEGDWLLIEYEVHLKKWRRGYVKKDALHDHGAAAAVPDAQATAWLQVDCGITDDPSVSQEPICYLAANDTVTYLHRNGKWAYVQAMTPVGLVRGYLPQTVLSFAQ